MAKDLSLGVIGTVAKDGQSKHLNQSGRVCHEGGRGRNDGLLDDPHCEWVGGCLDWTLVVC